MKRLSTTQWLVLMDGEYPALFSALSNLSDQIKQIWKSDDLKQNEDGDIVAFSEELTAALIGSAFVVCQIQISRVVSAIQDYQKEQHRTDGRKPCADPQKIILALGEKVTDGSCSYSKAAIIWHLGNYFKHADEWAPDWASANSKARDTTIPAIKVAGLSSSKTYIENLYQGASFLGTDNGHDLLKLHWILHHWKLEVVRSLVPDGFR